ncbi:MAG TPA: hypothetical protein VH062_07075 [Polyangiaceae bacterium]|jgi:hypothetical protein|nr:hypothetical protein [Polyangiaceae bacterium]
MTREPPRELSADFATPAPASSSNGWTRLRRWWVVFRAHRAIRALESSRATRDVAPRVLFTASFVAYFSVGWALERRGAFAGNNLLFQADCVRAISDMLAGPSETPSNVIALGHPLLAILVNPFAVAIHLVLGEPGDLPVRLLCNGAAALAAMLSYRVFCELGAPRRLAGAAATVYALSSSELVFGSMPETFGFVPLALTASVFVALRSVRPFENALVQITAFGLNTALAPHSAFCAPVLWFPRLERWRWVRTTGAFLVALAAVTVVLAKLQELLYPGVGYFFQKHGIEAYSRWASMPVTRAALLERGAELTAHFFVFSVVAPIPLLTSDGMTTFMAVQTKTLAHYDVLGGAVAVGWCLAALVATVSNVYSFVTGDTTVRARLVFFAGWMFGTFGLFGYFGDDLHLYSTLWTFHWVAWIVMGLTPLVRRIRGGEGRARWLDVALLTFVGLFALNEAVFVHRMIEQHGSAGTS